MDGGPRRIGIQFKKKDEGMRILYKRETFIQVLFIN